MTGLRKQMDEALKSKYNRHLPPLEDILAEWNRAEKLEKAQTELRQRLAVAKMFDVITQEEFDTLHAMSNSKNIEDVEFALIILEEKRGRTKVNQNGAV